MSALPPRSEFEGRGVYAIYYLGGLPFYRPLCSEDCRVPIYVGKALPTGARKSSRRQADSGRRELWRRLREHAKSIELAQNLALDDFRCRYLVVVPVWISLAERFLIEHFQPLWNVVVDGFGNHDPGEGRKDMQRPRWDILHPGRPWAARLRAAESEEKIIALIEERSR